MPQQTTTLLLRGGLNIVSPALAVPPGQCIAAANYEAEVRGYRRLDGYERFDGHPRPSQASYWVLNFTNGDTAVVEGDVVTGGTSGATGKALIAGVVSAGAYGTSDASGYLVLTDVSGTFQDNEDIEVSASPVALADGTAVELAADNDSDDTTWRRDAVATRRALISAVSGSGPIRGVAVYGGAVYAVRDNAGATAGILHKSTASGWQAQDLGSIIFFDAGTAEFTEGETLTGGTSGATATVRRVTLTAGTWDGSAAGFLTISGITGTFQDNETVTDGGSGSAAADGTVVANALPAGGRYQFTVRNFLGQANLTRLYGVNGVGRAFEWDGTYFTPIHTGLSDTLDKPTRLAEFANHLMLGYDGGSVLCSGIGRPREFLAALGAAEFTLGSDITDMIEATSTALIIFGRNKIGYVTGTDADTFVLSMISEESGAVAWSAQVVGSPIYMDDAGLRRLTTTSSFGDWRTGTLTQAIEPFFRQKRKAGATVTASIRVKGRDIYRVFYDDGAAISLYMGRKTAEPMPLDLPIAVTCSVEGAIWSEDADSMFVGDDEGFVYELDRGASFDGDEVVAYIRLPFNTIGAPTINKRWHKVTLEVDAAPTAALFMIAEYDYGSFDLPAGVTNAFTVQAGGGFWNEANWDSFYWSAQVVGQAYAYLDGIGTNMSLVIRSEATYEDAHTLAALTINFSPRGLKR